MTKRQLRTQANEAAAKIVERLNNPAKLTIGEIGGLLLLSWSICSALLSLQCKERGVGGADFA